MMFWKKRESKWLTVSKLTATLSDLIVMLRRWDASVSEQMLTIEEALAEIKDRDLASENAELRIQSQEMMGILRVIYIAATDNVARECMTAEQMRDDIVSASPTWLRRYKGQTGRTPNVTAKPAPKRQKGKKT